jgi:hypothetical protein
MCVCFKPSSFVFLAGQLCVEARAMLPFSYRPHTHTLRGFSILLFLHQNATFVQICNMAFLRPTYCTHDSICLSVLLYIYLSVSPSIYLSVCPSIYLYVCPSIYLAVCPIYLSVYLSVRPSIYLSVCSSIYLTVCPSIYLYVCPSIYLSVCPPIYLSVYLSFIAFICRCRKT